MNYAKINKIDSANGIGVRVTLFVSGCTHHCVGCFNEEAWDFHYGKPFTQETIDELLDLIDKPYIRGLTLLGGEPLEKVNQEALLPLLRTIKQKLPNKDIWCYSGYLYEDLLENGRAHCQISDELLSYIDVLVDGPFILSQKNISLRFKGSKNQRIIDLKATKTQKRLVLWDDK